MNPFHLRTIHLLVPMLLSACTSQNIQGVEYMTFPGGEHRAGKIEYSRFPAAGGPHSPTWQTCGVYPAPLYSEQAVHSLEHGAVWITYRRPLSSGDLQALTRLTEGRTHVLISPHDQQAAPVVLSAWGTQLTLKALPDPRVGAFLDRYERGPRAPERDAPCSGGSTETQ